jgi:hypothetical protein
MTGDDKLEALNDWQLVFYVDTNQNSIWFYFILSDSISFKRALYIRAVLHPHINFSVIDSVITLITGTISLSDFKRLFVTFQTELSSDNAPIATLSVIDQAVGPSCPLVPLCNRITIYTTSLT